MGESTREATRVYRNHGLDSTRWKHYRPRPTDVVVSTPYKSGTTWTLAILRELFALGEELPPFREMWLDCAFRQTPEDFFAELEAQEHRRYIKSHVARDGVPYLSDVRYIVVGRDVRDVFMSLWNHYRTMHELDYIEYMNAIPGRSGPPLPDPPGDLHRAWRDWIGRGWFAWEEEGWPFWGTMHHLQSWWPLRDHDNVLFVHFNDLKRDLGGEVRRIAAFVGIDVPDSALPAVRAATSVDAMHEHMAKGSEAFANGFFKHRGTNGRWRDTLTHEDLALYDRKAAQVLEPSCRAWLEDLP